MSIDGWMDKENVVYIYNGILFSHKKENLAICDNMDGPWGHYAKWNKSVKDKPYDLTYMWDLKFENKRAHRYREQIGGYQRWGVGGGPNG